MKFEKRLGRHECASAAFIRQMWDEDQDLSLTRAQLGDMKKFLIVMMYRNDQRRLQYFNCAFDPITAVSVITHMKRNKIPNTQTLWFEDLKWTILASPEDIVKEYDKKVKAVRTTGSLTSYQGPILSAVVQDFGYLVGHTIACMWQAEEGSEFILSEGCFGSWEGGPGYWLHNFFIVSPRMANVLVCKKHMEGKYPGKNSPWTSMFEDSLHDFPETDYKNGLPPEGFDRATHFTPDDVFKYKRFIVPKKTVYKVNSIILNNARESLTYKCSISMLKTLHYYHKVQAELFHGSREYPKLRRKVFMELNRTHS